MEILMAMMVIVVLLVFAVYVQNTFNRVELSELRRKLDAQESTGEVLTRHLNNLETEVRHLKKQE